MTDRNAGSRASTAAAWVSYDQVSELLAIKLRSLHGIRSPIMASHMAGPVMRPMVRRGLLRSEIADPPWVKRKWRVPALTNLGEHVLLIVAERAMVEIGVCDSLASVEEDGE